MSYPTILEVVPGSPAASAGIAVGDELLAVNGVRPSDVIEYQQLVDEPAVALSMRRSGDTLDIEIEKMAGAPLGLRLDSSIFDRVQTCDNHCEFCFIYQLPPGMRKSLYLKDDDYRLSFLYGNFTTLTRFTELDLARVVEERLGPLYVSIHTTVPDVRARMLRNPRGATSLRWLRALLDHGVTVHGQIVLLPEVNGGDVLEQTCAEILVTYPALASVGVVPLGLSRYNPEPGLVPHTPETAARDLEILEFWRGEAHRRLGRRLFFASDELYLMAGVDFPPVDEYEQFPQHENGIGMARAFYEELDRLEHGTPIGAPAMTGEWRSVPGAPSLGYRAPRQSQPMRVPRPPRRPSAPATILTGEYGGRVLEPVRPRLERLAGTSLRILPIANEFFGGNTAVAGLLVGADVRRALERDSAPTTRYVLPDVCLSGDRFLDDATLAEVAGVARAPVVPAVTTAAGMLQALSA